MDKLCGKIIAAMREKKLKLAVAESCTGGLVSKLITDTAGCSDVFCGGIISYSDEIKKSLLGVNAQTLSEHGAVSNETAAEMASGVKRICGCDIGISTTGIAGPSGAAPEKPVGTVYIGISYLNNCDVKLLNINPDFPRSKIREYAARAILELLYKKIVEMY